MLSAGLRRQGSQDDKGVGVVVPGMTFVRLVGDALPSGPSNAQLAFCRPSRRVLCCPGAEESTQDGSRQVRVDGADSAAYSDVSMMRFATTQRRDAFLAPHPLEDNPDLLFGGEPASRLASDVLNNLLCGLCVAHGDLLPGQQSLSYLTSSSGPQSFDPTQCRHPHCRRATRRVYREVAGIRKLARLNTVTAIVALLLLDFAALDDIAAGSEPSVLG